MESIFHLDEYLSNGIDAIVKGALKASFKNPKESIFITKYAYSVKEARRIRLKYEEKEEHIPPFLIASITSSCNLHCKGCYARANHMCKDGDNKSQLSAQEWKKIFKEAGDLGISFILLAGGEPLIRMDIMEAAADYSNLLFPIFTNGMLINETYLKLFDKKRNLLPVLSIEGGEQDTDNRRGEGVYQNLISVMKRMKQKGIFYGASITVTKDNIKSISDEAFIKDLYSRGCKVVFLIEYVPISISTKEFAPGEEERGYLERRLQALRAEYEDMIFISFPGDEKSSGGCLAAGRGFFHINPSGGTEPCPFSPFTDTNLKDVTLLEALHSPLFQKLRESHLLLGEHTGGCVLFEQEEEVKKLCAN